MGNKSSLMLQDDEIKQINEETGFSAPQVEKLYARFTHLDRASCGSLSKGDLMSIPELAINPLCDRLVGIFLAESRGNDSGAGGGGGQPRRNQQHGRHQPDDRINFRQFMRVLAAFRSSSSSPAASQTNDSTSSSIGRFQRAGRQSPPGAGQLQSHSGSLAAAASKLAVSLRRHKPMVEPAAAGGGGSAPLVSDSLRDKLYFVYKIYDADGDGRISFNDLRTILKLMVGGYIEDVQLDKIATRAFVEVDRDHDGFIEFHEFCKVFAGKDMDLFRLCV